jgi:ABC-type multidrug transport system ATPase subunit
MSHITHRSATPAIAVEELRKSFGKTQALAGVDLQVEKGSVLGVLGPNGAGKTTVEDRMIVSSQVSRHNL